MIQEATVQTRPPEQWKSESIAKLLEALAKAQGSFPVIEKRRTAEVIMKSGGKYTYNFADLADVIAAIKDPLSKNGLTQYQFFFPEGGKNILVTVLSHSSGEWIKSVLPLPPASDPQHFGSILTYYRRYTLQAIVGVFAEEDDDGKIAAEREKAMAAQKPASKPQSKPSPVTPKERPQSAPASKPQPKAPSFKEFLESYGWTEAQAQEWVTVSYDLKPGEKSSPAQIRALKEVVQTMPPEDAIFVARNPG